MKKILAAAVLAALSVGTANAALSFSNAEQTTEISQTGFLDLFDTNLGTLNSVTLTLNGAMTTTIDLSNSAAQSQTARGTGTVDLMFSSSLAGLDLSAVLMSLTATTGFQTLASGASASFGPLTDADTVALTPTAALFGAAGGGTFSISCESFSGLGVQGGGGNVAASQTTTAGCGASIVYDFTPTPPHPRAGTRLHGAGRPRHDGSGCHPSSQVILFTSRTPGGTEGWKKLPRGSFFLLTRLAA